LCATFCSRTAIICAEFCGSFLAMLCPGTCIISQCYFFGFNRAIRQRHFDAGRVTDEHLQGLIDHITNFCLSGIRDVRARLAGREADSAPSASTGSGSAPQPATARHEKNLPHRAKGISN
jgi:hypothetical protein